MSKLTDDQAKKQHIEDARKAIIELESSNVAGWEYRKECLLEMIIMLENGNNLHINPAEEEKKEPEHFK